MNNRIIPLKVCHGVWKNYCYLIVDDLTKEVVIIDPAWELSTIIQGLNKEALTLKAAFLTHSHEDHSNLAPVLEKIYKIPVFIHQNEIDYYNFFCPSLESIKEDKAIYIGRNLIIHPLWTPGHTKGSICYMNSNSLFTGDTLFLEGCGICDPHEGGSPEEMFSTLMKIKNNVLENTKVYPGHSYGAQPGLTFQEAKKLNVYLHFTNSNDFIKFRMRENQAGLYSFK